MQFLFVVGLVAICLWMWSIHVFLMRANYQSLYRPVMGMARAKEITSQCVNACMYRTVGIGDPCDLPDCTLEEMLEANRLMRGYSEPSATGGRNIYLCVDPRGLGLNYAYEHYGKNLSWLLEALGYELTED